MKSMLSLRHFWFNQADWDAGFWLTAYGFQVDFEDRQVLINDEWIIYTHSNDQRNTDYVGVYLGFGTETRVSIHQPSISNRWLRNLYSR